MPLPDPLERAVSGCAAAARNCAEALRAPDLTPDDLVRCLVACHEEYLGLQEANLRLVQARDPSSLRIGEMTDSIASAKRNLVQYHEAFSGEQRPVCMSEVPVCITTRSLLSSYL